MSFRLALLVAAISLSVIAVYAQPADTQVLKDISWPGVVKKELRPGAIKKVWSDAGSQYYWDRACVVWRNANIPEYPNAQIEIGGFARYSYVTNTYQDFLTTYNTYTGIPAPSNDEIMGMMKGNLRGVLGEYKFSKAVGQLQYMRFPENNGPTWESPTHLTVPVEVAYEMKEGPTWTVTNQDRLLVHFYRDAINAPWKDNVISEEKESIRGARKEYGEAELRRMPTLGSAAAEGQAQAAASTLPTIVLPEFASDKETVMFTVDVLRSGDEGRIRAYLMKMLVPYYFVEGSTTQLNQRGEDLMNEVIGACCKAEMPFGDQYCAKPGEKHYQPNHVELWNKTQDKYTLIKVGIGGTTWKNGQQVGGSYKLVTVEPGIWKDADNIARLRSYEPGFLCKQEGGEAKPATTSNTGSGSANTGKELLNKGRGLLNKLTTP